MNETEAIESIRKIIQGIREEIGRPEWLPEGWYFMRWEKPNTVCNFCSQMTVDRGYNHAWYIEGDMIHEFLWCHMHEEEAKAAITAA